MRTNDVTFEAGYLLIGALLVGVAAIASLVKRLPLTETIIYLVVGGALGSLGFGILSLDAFIHSKVLERLAEAAVIVSLFTAGLKLRVPLNDRRWRIPIRLAFLSMTLTVGMVALVAGLLFEMPLGAAIVLGAILSPTDPVLASDIQLANAHDRDRLRFSLTGEAGLNDGTAFPFIMLGLGFLGLHDIGVWTWKWLSIDVIWAVGAGLGIGAGCGIAVGWLVLYLRRERREGVGRDEFLALGLIALSYGTAVTVHAYGFLAVFAAGVALRALERRHTGDHPPLEVLEMGIVGEKDEIATDPEKAPAHMAGAVLAFNEHAERLLEVALVLAVGVALYMDYFRAENVCFAAILFLAIRPIAAVGGLIGCGVKERGLIAWFGVRGIGSLYYLMYAVNHGLSPELAREMISITLSVIAISIIVHGITVTPLMASRRKVQAPAANP